MMNMIGHSQPSFKVPGTSATSEEFFFCNFRISRSSASLFRATCPLMTTACLFILEPDFPKPIRNKGRTVFGQFDRYAVNVIGARVSAFIGAHNAGRWPRMRNPSQFMAHPCVKGTKHSGFLRTTVDTHNPRVSSTFRNNASLCSELLFSLSVSIFVSNHSLTEMNSPFYLKNVLGQQNTN